MKQEPHPQWAKRLADVLHPDLGGIPIFCDDPDGLLESGKVRDALRGRGLRIDYWDGQRESLRDWQDLAQDECVVVKVAPGSDTSLIRRCLDTHVRRRISIGTIFESMDPRLVRPIPVERWDALLDLESHLPPDASRRQQAYCIARDLYDVDLQHPKSRKDWVKRLLSVSINQIHLPEEILSAALRIDRGWSSRESSSDKERVFDALSTPPAARSLVETWIETDVVRKDQLQRTERLAYNFLRQGGANVTPEEDTGVEPDYVREKWDDDCRLDGLVEYIESYSAWCAESEPSRAGRESAHEKFTSWLQSNYARALSSQRFLSTHNVLEEVDHRAGDDRIVLIVVDAMGLEPWQIARETWKDAGVMKAATTKVAFAVMPTITKYGRRALFEETMPSGFSQNSHTQRLESNLWQEKYGSSAVYCTEPEKKAFEDAIDQQRKRICVLSTEWDKIGHNIIPGIFSISFAARRWAQQSVLKERIKYALRNEYRVFLTADHGLVPCEGVGRLGVGRAAEDKSRRVALFENQEVLDQHKSKGRSDFQPAGVPGDARVLFPPGLGSFDHSGVETVSHGGTSIEEVCVPLAELS
jgi:hypothetical protein